MTDTSVINRRETAEDLAAKAIKDQADGLSGYISSWMRAYMTNVGIWCVANAELRYAKRGDDDRIAVNHKVWDYIGDTARLTNKVNEMEDTLTILVQGSWVYGDVEVAVVDREGYKLQFIVMFGID